MRDIAAFFMGFLRSLKEFFQNDATGKLDYRFLLGVWFAYVLGSYVLRTPQLSDWSFIALCVLQALYIYGPSADLANYFKATFGGFKVPQSQTVNQTNVGTDSSTINGDAVVDTVVDTATEQNTKA